MVVRYFEPITQELLDTTKKSVDSFKDRLLIDYRLHTLAQQEYAKKAQDFICESLGDTDGLTFLDLGCGDGLQTAIFIDRLVNGIATPPERMKSADGTNVDIDMGNIEKEEYYRDNVADILKKNAEMTGYIRDMALLKREHRIKVYGIEGCPAMADIANRTGIYDERIIPSFFHQDLRLLEDSIDFAVCFSSTFGHESNLANARQAIDNMAKVVHPGRFIYIDALYGEDDVSFSRLWERIKMPEELKALDPEGHLYKPEGTYECRIRTYSFAGFRDLAGGRLVEQRYEKSGSDRLEAIGGEHKLGRKPISEENMDLLKQAEVQLGDFFWYSKVFEFGNKIMVEK